MTENNPVCRKLNGSAPSLKLITEVVEHVKVQHRFKGGEIVVADSCHGYKQRFTRHLCCAQKKKESDKAGTADYENTSASAQTASASENFARFEGFTSADLFTGEQRKFLADCTSMQRTKFWHWLRKGRITATRIVPLVSVIQKIYSYDTEDGKKINQALNRICSYIRRQRSCR